MDGKNKQWIKGLGQYRKKLHLHVQSKKEGIEKPEFIGSTAQNICMHIYYKNLTYLIY